MRHLFSSVIVFIITFAFLQAEEPSEPRPPQSQPHIDVVFVLDTTGSMSGMIAGAKERIWDIASTMASAQPTPVLRMGMVAYRDRGDTYVTQRCPLSTDLDAMFTQLMALEANGGGDHPESVNQALSEAVTGSRWSDSDQCYRVVFLVGDAPPKVYQDDSSYSTTCAAARERGIRINAIQCGNDSATRAAWTEIATLGEGDYSQVDQSGGVRSIASPYDEEMVELSRKLDATRCYYGDQEAQSIAVQRQEQAELIYKEATPAMNASRAGHNSSAGGKANFLGSQELVDAISSKQVTLADIAVDELPSELQAMSLEEREQWIATKATERQQIQSRISELEGKRTTWINEQRGDETGLDQAMMESIRKQSARDGIEIPAPSETSKTE